MRRALLHSSHAEVRFQTEADCRINFNRREKYFDVLTGLHEPAKRCDGLCLLAAPLCCFDNILLCHRTPKHTNQTTRKDPATVKLIGIFSLQAAWKLVLAEGEKATLIAVAAADDVGVYGLVASLG